MMKGDIVFLNYRSLSDTPSAESVPNLVPDKKLKSILDGDSEPYYKIESIEYPVKGSGGIYTEQFFESFLNVMRDRPIPGSKRGHTWESRPSSDLYTVGGRMDSKGDGTGTVHMKVYIPKNGDSDSNVGLIRDAKANIVHFSLVTWPEYTVTKDADGNEITKFTATKGYERNDAVEYGAGAMKQTVNSEFDWLDEAKKLIEAGKINAVDDSTEVIRNGFVMRTALRRIVSRAPNGNPEVANLISMIDKRNKESKVTKQEILDALDSARKNNDMTLEDCAKVFNQADRLMNDEARQALSLKNQFAELGVKDPVGEYKALAEKNAELAKAERSVALTNAFGAPDEKNLIRSYAEEKVPENAIGKNLADAIEAVKNSPIAKQLAGQMADPHSNVNRVTTTENDGINSEVVEL
jgi:hypothetical protein